MKLQGKLQERHGKCNGKGRDNCETAGKVARTASELQRKGPGQLRNRRESGKNGMVIATERSGTTMKLQGKWQERRGNCSGKRHDNYETAGKVARTVSEL